VIEHPLSWRGFAGLGLEDVDEESAVVGVIGLGVGLPGFDGTKPRLPRHDDLRRLR
jgi:hypothetical protein